MVSLSKASSDEAVCVAAFLVLRMLVFILVSTAFSGAKKCKALWK